jgi:uncharacterized membrane protein YkvA (DUF1232 family)
MGLLSRTATVAGAVRSSRGRHPLSARLVAVLPMLRDSFTGRWVGAPRGRLIAAMLGLVYVVSPLDLMPEILLGPFGLGDDLAIAVFAVAGLMSSAEEWLDRGETEAPFGAAGPGDVIQGIVVDRT